jgi:hypothetical protein
MFENINEVAVLVTAILSIAVGSVWYSPLFFGTIWLKSAGLRTIDTDLSQSEVVRIVLQGILAQFVFFYIIAGFVSLQSSLGLSVLEIGTPLAVLVVAGMLSQIIWEKRSWAYFLVHSGYTLAVLYSGLGIIYYWPW